MSNVVLITQKIFKADSSAAFALKTCSEDDLASHLPTFKATICDGVVGLAPVYRADFSLKSLAIAKENQPNGRIPRDALCNFLCDATISKVAFQMDRLVSSLFLNYSLFVVGGKDLLSLSGDERHSIQSLMNCLGGELTLHKQHVVQLFAREESAGTKPETTALQAWSAGHAAVVPHVNRKFEKIPSINTEAIEEHILMIIAHTVRNMALLDALKPLRLKNEIQQHSVRQGGDLTVVSQRYQTRLMRTAGHQTVEITTCKDDGSKRIIKAKVSSTKGRQATVSFKGSLEQNARLHSVETIGRSSPTLAEALKTSVLLHALQRQTSFSNHPFIQTMRDSEGGASWRKTEKLRTCASLYYPSRGLNPSQEKAVNAILSDKEKTRVVLIQGPPGTGKTTVIAAAVTSITSSSDQGNTLWLVAQSNVAVKNIAEKLASVDFLDFKILVAKDFHFDWHEHLYTKIKPNLIRSDGFVADAVVTERLLQGSRVILCTLSMLSNDRISAFSSLVPLETVVFDEASQIETGDYFPMLIRFRPTIRKLVFIGDNKQLAPYGASDIPGLGSIFEKSHLTSRAIFLDTQCSFISARVYKNRLKSKHSSSDPACCRFVDNVCEARVVIKVARQLLAAGKSFRIITPYDPQRSLLENKLKDAKLPWQDRCFNIDAFQGNEDDYIVISLVRSEKMGFLREMRRVNVMLTRCKKGMIICANRRFVEGKAAQSLVGQLAASLGHETWVGANDVLTKGVQPFKNPSSPTDSHHKMATTRRVFQPILDGRAPAVNKPLPTQVIPEAELSQSDISTVFDHPRPLGLSPGFDEDGRLVALAIADDTQCRIIEFQHSRRGKKAAALPKTILDGRQILQDCILCRPVGDLFAFDMAPLAMSIYSDLDARVTNAVDIQSAFPVKNPVVDRKPLVAIKAAIGESDIKIREDNVRDLFFYPTYSEDNRNRVSDLAIRAWVSQFLPSFENGAETFEKVTRIDTKKLEGPAIEMIGKLANDSLRLDQKKSTYTTHPVTQSVDAASSELRLSSNSFKARLRGDRRIRMGVEGNLGAFAVTATMGTVSGRSGNVNTTRNLTDKQITTVTSIGRDDPTTAEAKRAQSILQYLQGNQDLGPWVQNIWFPAGDDSPLIWPEEWTTQNSILKSQTIKPPNSKQKKEKQNQPPQRTLNPSQQKAVNTMLSPQDGHRIVLIQGPPGTGKTSVISTFVQFAVNLFDKKGIWLVAQSNVAVKNIAERLVKDGFEKWKLLVSRDFHYDWHEHLYAAEIGKHLIRSDEFQIASNKANLQGIHVILCTLSNEDDYIIISVVRSRGLGFLTNLRRTNVMLSRCKRGMFIVSSKQFLEGAGAQTLVGTLLQKIGTENWLTQANIEAGNF
ncbi:hypothetical protein NLJ89_g1766 [Agrocybe chaxingu]|uniref:Uncharacterized protein n=1 Tax=Agrocybe chaxingu TaxID=84603 RepID=A0A9W8MZF4_9AGAR|nr:hypothetical protein NLJ89_g1766 [Agrocybe chaxingu]